MATAGICCSRPHRSFPRRSRNLARLRRGGIGDGPETRPKVGFRRSEMTTLVAGIEHGTCLASAGVGGAIGDLIRAKHRAVRQQESQMRPRPIIALAPMLLIEAALGGCGQNLASMAPAQVCASKESLGRIKRAAFDEAAAEASSQNRYALDRLSEQAQASLKDPLVESYDRDTKKTTCTATLEMWLPAGVLSSRELHAPVRYVSQPMADGRGVAFTPSGLEEVASGVAGADVSAWAMKNAPRKPGLVVEVVPQIAATAVASQGVEGTDKLENGVPVSNLDRPSVTRAADVSRPRTSLLTDRVAQPLRPQSMQVAPRAAAAPQRISPSPTEPALLGGAARPVRVFVHIASPAQIGTADRVRAQLSAISVAGQPVVTPPVRYVAKLPSRTEVRCLKRADCPAARQVARYLAQDLGAAVAVVDMSDTYENDPGVRPGSLELWLHIPR